MTRNRSFETHAGWGAAIAAVLVAGGHHAAIAAAVTYAAGWAVEGAQALSDRLGTYDPWDAHYTGMGGVLGALAATGVQYVT